MTLPAALLHSRAMAKRRVVRQPSVPKADRLVRLMSEHAQRATQRFGKLRSCGCDMCRYAARMLEWAARGH